MTAVANWGLKDVKAAFEKEVIYKQFTKYKALELINYKDIEPNAVRLRSQMLYKKKVNGTISGRLPADGSSQPPDSYIDTYAATSDQTNANALYSTIPRDCANRGTEGKVVLGHFDVPAAFINNLPLTKDKTGGRQVVMRLPLDLPDASLAGRWVQVKMCIYGMKQSNHEFDKSLNEFLSSLGYKALPSDTRLYIKRAPDKTLLAIRVHVDDGGFISDNPDLIDELEAAVKARYGDDVSFSRNSDGICSVRFTRLSNGDLKLDCGPYIRKQLAKWGMDNVPPALTSSLPGLFTTPTDDVLLDPAGKHDFQVVNGTMVFPLAVRGDVAFEINLLCSRNQNPTVGDHKKQI